MQPLAEHKGYYARTCSCVQDTTLAAADRCGGAQQNGIGANLKGGALVLYGKLFKAEHPGFRLNKAAVLHVKGTVADGGQLRIVGDDDYCLPELFAKLQEELVELCLCNAVKVAGRLVGQ